VKRGSGRPPSSKRLAQETAAGKAPELLRDTPYHTRSGPDGSRDKNRGQFEERRHRISNQSSALIPKRPMKMGLLAVPEARVLDLAGPWEAFSRANEVVAELGSTSEPAYHLKLAAIDGSRSAVCFGGSRH